MEKVIVYDFKLTSKNGRRIWGRTKDKKYIDNLIKYKGRIGKKKNKLSIVRGELICENERYRTINEEVIFNNF